MRIVFRGPGFPPDIGGMETLAGQLLPALRERGHEVLVIAGGRSSIRSANGATPDIAVRRFPFTTALLDRDLGQIAKLRVAARRAEEEFQPDLVHLNFGGPDAFFQLFERDCPTLLTMHAPVPEGADANPMIARLARTADWTIAVSRAVLDDVLRFAPEIADRSSVLYNGVLAPDRPASAPSFDPPRILCLGRVSPEKGFDVAIDALPRVRESHPGARLTIAGDGRALDSLRRRAATRGVGDAVDFTGAVAREDVPAAIEQASLVAIPSRWREPFCLVAVEAAQAERPVVASDIGGLRETVADGKTGTLVPIENAAALGDALVALLDEPAKAARMGTAARERATRLFGIDACADAHDRLYRGLVATAGERASA